MFRKFFCIGVGSFCNGSHVYVLRSWYMTRLAAFDDFLASHFSFLLIVYPRSVFVTPGMSSRRWARKQGTQSTLNPYRSISYVCSPIVGLPRCRGRLSFQWSLTSYLGRLARVGLAGVAEHDVIMTQLELVPRFPRLPLYLLFKDTCMSVSKFAIAHTRSVRGIYSSQR